MAERPLIILSFYVGTLCTFYANTSFQTNQVVELSTNPLFVLLMELLHWCVARLLTERDVDWARP